MRIHKEQGQPHFFEWVAILPLDNKPPKNIYLFVFGEDGCVSAADNLIMIWDKSRKKIDYSLPPQHRKRAKDGISKRKKEKERAGEECVDLAAKIKARRALLTKAGVVESLDRRAMLPEYKKSKPEQQLLKRYLQVLSMREIEELFCWEMQFMQSTILVGTYGEMCKSRPPHERRKICALSISNLEETLISGHGTWKDILPKAIDHKLIKKYSKHPWLLRLLNRGNPLSFQEFELRINSSRQGHLLSMSQINREANLETVTASGIDPLRKTREFLKFIGVYPSRQGGESKRRRLTDETKTEIAHGVLKLDAKGKNEEAIRTAFKECANRFPKKHEIKTMRELIRKKIEELKSSSLISRRPDPAEIS